MPDFIVCLAVLVQLLFFLKSGTAFVFGFFDFFSNFENVDNSFL